MKIFKDLRLYTQKCARVTGEIGLPGTCASRKLPGEISPGVIICPSLLIRKEGTAVKANPFALYFRFAEERLDYINVPSLPQFTRDRSRDCSRNPTNERDRDPGRCVYGRGYLQSYFLSNRRFPSALFCLCRYTSRYRARWKKGIDLGPLAVLPFRGLSVLNATSGRCA